MTFTSSRDRLINRMIDLFGLIGTQVHYCHIVQQKGKTCTSSLFDDYRYLPSEPLTITLAKNQLQV